MTDNSSENTLSSGGCSSAETTEQNLTGSEGPTAERIADAAPAQEQPEASQASEATAASPAPTEADEDRDRKLAALEAVLFMAAEPISSAELAEILGVTPAGADELALELSSVYEQRGLQVARVAGGYQTATRPEYGQFVAKLHKPERFRLSRAALETLAIIAYKQPITRPEIEAIRGVNSDSPVDTLSQYELICEVGRKEAPGRPVLYRTTDSFLGTFGLNSVDDLPHLDTIPADEEAIRAEVSHHTAASDEEQSSDEPEGELEAPEVGEGPGGDEMSRPTADDSGVTQEQSA